MTIQPLRRVFDVVNGGTPTAEPENWGGDVPWATPVDLGRLNGQRIGETQRTITADGLRTGSSLVPAGSLIVSTRAPIGYVGETTIPMAFNQGCRGLVPRTELDVRFFRYQLLASAERLQARGQGSTFLELSTDGLASFPLVVPPVEHQRAIADYLDAETARIDSIVSARSRQVALMRERADVAITERLHAGGTPLVPLGRVVDLVAGFSFQSEDFLPDGGPIRLLRGINVDVGSTRWDETLWVGQDVAQATSRFGLAPGDVVMGMDRPVISTGVRVAQVTSADLPAMLVQRVARLRARTRVSQDYLYLALRAPGLAAHFEPMFTGVSVPHVSPSQILTYEIPVPAPAAQAEIVGSIRAIDDHARTCEAATRLQVDLLLERRQALITAAVTGQLEIPGFAA